MLDTHFDTAAHLLTTPQPSESLLQTAISKSNKSYWDINSHGTLLHIAAKYDTMYDRNAKWVKVLVQDFGFDPNSQGPEGSTPLLWAICAYIYTETADLSSVKYLLSLSNIDVNAKLKHRGSLTTHLLTHYPALPRLQVVLALLKHHQCKRIRSLLLVRFRVLPYRFTH